MNCLKPFPATRLLTFCWPSIPTKPGFVRSWLPEEYGRVIDNLMTFPKIPPGAWPPWTMLQLEPAGPLSRPWHIRKVGKTELISYVYVLNPGPAGRCSVNKGTDPGLPETKLSELVSKNPIFVRADSDQEEAARLLSQYDFLAIPVVDADNRMVGIISVDDLVDVIQDEATEDIRERRQRAAA